MQKVYMDLNRIFTPWRLKWYPRAYLFALVIGLTISILSGEGASTLAGRLGGDYPAFYVAGRIISQGDGDKLYDSEYQANLQKEFHLGESNVLLPFPYPPFMAAAYYPFSIINYRLSYTLHTALMIAFIFLAIWLLRPLNDLINANFLLFVAIVLSFYPMMRAVLNGQNTALTFLLLVISWRACLANRDMLAGIALGLLLFKPQFALPLIGLFIISGRLRVGLAALITAAALYSISCIISSSGWIIEWYNFAIWLSIADAEINCDKAISWIGFLQAILGWKNNPAIFIGWSLSLATAIFLIFIWMRRGLESDLTSKLAISVSALVLIPPHVNYYDLGIVIFSCICGISLVKRENPWLPLGLVWTLGFTQIFSSYFGFSLLFPVALFIFLFSIKYLANATYKGKALMNEVIQ